MKLLHNRLAALLIVSPYLFGEATEISDRELFLEWSATIVEAIEVSAPPPCLASRNLAILHAAAFNAINATGPSYEFYIFEEAIEGDIDAVSAAINAIAFGADIFFPSHRAEFRKLRERQYMLLKESVSKEKWIRSKQFGESVVKRLIDHRSNDGSSSMLTYIPKNEVGKWRRTPPRYRPPELSYWANTRPFALKSASQFRLEPPPSIASKQYAAALQEVREIGSIDSEIRTEEQTEIAQFWSCFSYTSTPAGHWYEIATRASRERQLPLIESARLLALATMAMADAGIACWDTKYQYESWRPILAIRGADRDGNPLSSADKSWNSLLEAPPHPEYVSGHAAFSGAGGRIMELFFEAESGFPFSTTSSSLPGVVRQFDSFADCVDEICLSRLYGGIHFRYSNDLGRDLGEQVAEFVFNSQLQPIK